MKDRVFPVNPEHFSSKGTGRHEGTKHINPEEINSILPHDHY